MITLRFTYHEIIDTDRTAIDITVLDNHLPVAAFRNYAPDALTKEIYANQSESFQLPDLATALAMIRSNGEYQECAIESLAN